MVTEEPRRYGPRKKKKENLGHLISLKTCSGTRSPIPAPAQQGRAVERGEPAPAPHRDRPSGSLSQHQSLPLQTDSRGQRPGEGMRTAPPGVLGTGRAAQR